MSGFFFSIVTATFNASRDLPAMLDSLARQTCRDFELVAQDGGSTDDTLAVLNAWRDRLPAMSLASDPDHGIYDAWNKALERIRGQWALFLGADDVLYAPDVLESVKTMLEVGNPDGRLLFAGGAVLMTAGRHSADGVLLRYNPDCGDRSVWHGMPFPHQGLFHHHSVFADNRFDATLRIVADYDFMCRCWTRENGGLVLPLTVTVMGKGGISDRPEMFLTARREEALVAARYFKRVWTPYRLAALALGGMIWALCRIIGRRYSGAVLEVLRKAHSWRRP